MSYQNANALKAEFICPFNAYHKQQDARKLSFHIGRCGDRKRKVVYKCQYNNSHIFIDARQLIMHEQNCELKVNQDNRSDSGQQILDPSLPEDMRKLIDQTSVRAPFCAYCKFNVAHCFKSILERDSHEETCPDRNLYEINAQKIHQIFSRNKNWILQAKLQKKAKNQQKIELGLSINTPESRAMPYLTYKYCMNILNYQFYE